MKCTERKVYRANPGPERFIDITGLAIGLARVTITETEAAELVEQLIALPSVQAALWARS